jgi:hypothetical protein
MKEEEVDEAHNTLGINNKYIHTLLTTENLNDNACNLINNLRL